MLTWELLSLGEELHAECGDRDRNIQFLFIFILNHVNVLNITVNIKFRFKRTKTHQSHQNGPIMTWHR